LNDIIDLNAKGSLSTAEFYEMLEFVNGKLLSG